MLENQIKALNEAVIANTVMLEKVLAALTNNAPVIAKAEPKPETVEAEPEKAETKTKVKPESKAAKAEPIIEPEPEATNIVSANDLKGLAKEAIAGGVLRTEIKKLITDAGADTISALDDEQRVGVYNALAKLRGV